MKIYFRVASRFIDEETSSSGSFDDCLINSYRVAGNIYFYGEMKIGIETAMVYRGKRKPQWGMKTLEEVPDDVVDYIFHNNFKENTLTLKQLTDLDTTSLY